LDADVVLLRPFTAETILQFARSSSHNYTTLSYHPKAMYENESRFLYHPDWWEASEAFLGIKSKDPSSQGFSVTPAVLSTFGSLLTLETIAQSVKKRLRMAVGVEVGEIDTSYPTRCEGGVCNTRSAYDAEVEHHWLHRFGSVGVVWTEYTLYRIVLDHYQV
jgi:hypothetical protein